MKKKISDATLGEKKRLGKGEKGRFADPRLLLPATTSAAPGHGARKHPRRRAREHVIVTPTMPTLNRSTPPARL